MMQVKGSEYLTEAFLGTTSSILLWHILKSLTSSFCMYFEITVGDMKVLHCCQINSTKIKRLKASSRTKKSIFEIIYTAEKQSKIKTQLFIAGLNVIWIYLYMAMKHRYNIMHKISMYKNLFGLEKCLF